MEAHQGGDQPPLPGFEDGLRASSGGGSKYSAEDLASMTPIQRDGVLELERYMPKGPRRPAGPISDEELAQASPIQQEAIYELRRYAHTLSKFDQTEVYGY